MDNKKQAPLYGYACSLKAANQIRTGAWQICNLFPYHLGMAATYEYYHGVVLIFQFDRRREITVNALTS